jgi:hypothetical protein
MAQNRHLAMIKRQGPQTLLVGGERIIGRGGSKKSCFAAG